MTRIEYYDSLKGESTKLVREFISTKTGTDSWSNGKHFFVFRQKKCKPNTKLHQCVEEVSEEVFLRLAKWKQTLLLPILEESEYQKLPPEKKIFYKPVIEEGRQLMSLEEAYEHGVSPYEEITRYYPTWDNIRNCLDNKAKAIDMLTLMGGSESCYKAAETAKEILGFVPEPIRNTIVHNCFVDLDNPHIKRIIKALNIKREQIKISCHDIHGYDNTIIGSKPVIVFNINMSRKEFHEFLKSHKWLKNG